MKRIIIASLCVVFAACQPGKENNAQLKTQKDSMSYAVGRDIVRNLKRQSIEINPDALYRGIMDMYTGAQGPLTDSQSLLISAALRKQMMAKHAEERSLQVDKNRKDGAAFLETNRKNKEVVCLPSGLQYTVLKTGTGPKPGNGQMVTLDYRGTLIDGTEFERNDTGKFSMDGVIKGWAEALKLMPVGSKWRLFIPADLAYGERGAGQSVPPGAALIFDVELLHIN
jgi:FKBP-type peptidyl-prolyl cis-trans isomerase